MIHFADRYCHSLVAKLRNGCLYKCTQVQVGHLSRSHPLLTKKLKDYSRIFQKKYINIKTIGNKIWDQVNT